MQAQRWFVTTDRDGVQRLRAGEMHWQLGKAGSPFAGVSVESAEPPLELVGAEGLLDRLDERIFLAEPGVGAEPRAAEGGVVEVTAARLTGEAPWDPERAAGFALDALEHAFGDELDLALPHGQTLGGVLAEARSALGEAGKTGNLFASIGRLGRLRQLRRLRTHLGDTAFALAKEDERDDLDLLDDPAWATLAALGEGVLAALEALRTAVAPRYVSATEDRQPAAERASGSFDLQTPWGSVNFGAEHVPEREPAARSVRDALERARQAVADRDGQEAVRAERLWQAAALEALLVSG